MILYNFLGRNNEEIEAFEKNKTEMSKLREIKKFEISQIYEEIKKVEQSIVFC
jgi:hypothetical protein